MMSVRQFWLGRAGRFLGWLLDHITSICLVIGGFMILFLAIVTTYGVVRRYIFGSPDDNAYLISCILMLGCFVFSIAHIQRMRKHITVDYLSQLLPPKVREFVINICGPILGLVFCVPLIWKSWENAWFAFQTGQTTITVTEIPTFPMQMAVPFFACLLCLVLIAQVLRYIFSLRGK